MAERDRPSRPSFIAKAPKLDVVDEPLGSSRRHIMEVFGKPVLARRFEGGGGRARSLEVALFGTAPLPYVAATAGAAEAVADDGLRREYLFAVEHFTVKGTQQQALLEVVAGAAGSAPVVGELVSAGALGDVFPVTRMSVLVALPAWLIPEEDRRFTRKDGAKVELTWLVPLHVEEAELVQREGYEALYDRCAVVQADLLDLARGPVPIS